jgi:hypothetical protein
MNVSLDQTIEMRAKALKRRAGRRAPQDSKRSPLRMQPDLPRWKRRQKWRVDRTLLINQRSDIGDTPEEVAGRLGISLASLRESCVRWGFALFQRKGFRQIGAWLRDRLVSVLDAYAAGARISREIAASELLFNALRARQARRAAA